jgi:dihydrofolate reductase
MRRVRYQVAASLDGYIAGPNGEADWIPMDPDIDFGALFSQFDTLLMGRRTYEGLAGQGGPGMFSGMKFGGGALFRSLLELGLVDTVEVAVLPVLLGEGIPRLPSPSPRATLTLTRHRVYNKTGTVLLEYAVKRGRARARA